MAFYEYEKSSDGKGYYFWFEYDPDLVAAIKQVPANFRRWEPEDRVWYVDRDWFQDACRFMDSAIEKNTGRKSNTGREKQKRPDEGFSWDRWKQDPFGGKKTHAPNAPAADPVAKAFTALHLQTDAPLPVIEAVYRVLALLHHPDRGGKHERMVEINLAYEKAKQFATK